MSDKSKRKVVEKIKTKAEFIRRLQSKAEVTKFNSTVLGCTTTIDMRLIPQRISAKFHTQSNESCITNSKR